MQTISITDFINEHRWSVVVDVRTPQEFSSGHIPGAINIPLFNDEERVIIGKLYKQAGKEVAIEKGLDLVGPKMKQMVRAARKAAGGKPLVLHCWRGGMRSAAMRWLFDFAGIPAVALKGGYKSYRRYLHAFFEKMDQTLLILGGETGSGKTEVLKIMAGEGHQIIDLEGLANHKGSSFGGIGNERQPTPEHFENLLFDAWHELDQDQPVWLEDEAHSIGRVYIPLSLWRKMKAAPIYRLVVPKEERVRRLVKEYGAQDRSELEEALKRISKRLGGQHVKKAIEALREGDLDTTAGIALDYYDKAYDFNHAKREYRNVYFLESDTGDPEANAELLMNYLKNENHMVKI